MKRTLFAGRLGPGFSLVELLIAMTLASIVFAAMVPVFVNAQKRSSGDRARNIASTLAQDRIEKLRLLSFEQIVDDTAHLQSNTYAGGQFGSSYTPTGSTKPYQIDYMVENVPSVGAINYKRVSVTVTWTAPPSPAVPVTMTTIVMNPSAASNSSSPSPSPSPSSTPTPTPSATSGLYRLTVGVTTSDVTSAGVTVVRTDVTPNVPATPALLVPTVATPAVWAGLAGGPGIKYLITCNYKPKNKAKKLTQTITLTGDTPITFDTAN